MKLDTFLKLFVPKNTSFFPYFEMGAANVIAAADLLKLLIITEDWEQRQSIRKQIKDHELAGDRITLDVYEQLNKSFITPFDREDIHTLASCIDDVLDSINGISQRYLLFKPKAVFPLFIDMADLVYESALEMQIAVNGLKDAGKSKEQILKACNALNILENKGDEVYHNGISKLFDTETDTTELIKKKEIMETLEKCIDKAEDVSDVIKTIMIKMA